jgi:hypothetical protein
LERYGIITSKEKDDNLERMQVPCTRPTPIENLFNQLEDGMAFEEAAAEPLQETAVTRMGVNNKFATGLFKYTCRGPIHGPLSRPFPQRRRGHTHDHHKVGGSLTKPKRHQLHQRRGFAVHYPTAGAMARPTMSTILETLANTSGQGTLSSYYKSIIKATVNTESPIPLPFRPPTPPATDTPPPSKLPITADSSCTSQFLTHDSPVTNKRPANPGISVSLPDGSTIESSHTANLRPQAPLASSLPLQQDRLSVSANYAITTV